MIPVIGYAAKHSSSGLKPFEFEANDVGPTAQGMRFLI